MAAELVRLVGDLAVPPAFFGEEVKVLPCTKLVRNLLNGDNLDLVPSASTTFKESDEGGVLAAAAGSAFLLDLTADSTGATAGAGAGGLAGIAVVSLVLRMSSTSLSSSSKSCSSTIFSGTVNPISIVLDLSFLAWGSNFRETVADEGAESVAVVACPLALVLTRA